MAAGNSRNFRVDIQGLRELRKAVRDLPKDVQKELRTSAYRPLAEELLSRALPLVPVYSGPDKRVKVGHLRDSLITKVGATFAGVQVESTNVRYANFIHWGAIGWPKARGRDQKAANRRKARANRRQNVRFASTDGRKIPGTLFLWRPAKQMAKGQNSEVKKILEFHVNQVLTNLMNDVSRSSSAKD
jgi:hypothetical protein